MSFGNIQRSWDAGAVAGNVGAAGSPHPIPVSTQGVMGSSPAAPDLPAPQCLAVDSFTADCESEDDAALLQVGKGPPRCVDSLGPPASPPARPDVAAGSPQVPGSALMNQPREVEEAANRAPACDLDDDEDDYAALMRVGRSADAAVVGAQPGAVVEGAHQQVGVKVPGDFGLSGPAPLPSPSGRISQDSLPPWWRPDDTPGFGGVQAGTPSPQQQVQHQFNGFGRQEAVGYHSRVQPAMPPPQQQLAAGGYGGVPMVGGAQPGAGPCMRHPEVRPQVEHPVQAPNMLFGPPVGHEAQQRHPGGGYSAYAGGPAYISPHPVVDGPHDGLPQQGPPCHCGLPSLVLTVRKEGPTKGRQFNKCSKPNSEQCAFWQWADEAPTAMGPPCACGIPSTQLKVAREGANQGRIFYKCAKRLCEFFSWADEENGGRPPANRSAVATPARAGSGTMPKAGGDRSGDVCYKCGFAGHWAQDCPNDVPGGRSFGGAGAGGSVCYKCNCSGHWARDCPNEGLFGGGKGSSGFDSGRGQGKGRKGRGRGRGRRKAAQDDFDFDDGFGDGYRGGYEPY